MRRAAPTLPSRGPGLSVWAPARDLLVTSGSRFVPSGLGVPTCTVGMRLGPWGRPWRRDCVSRWHLVALQAGEGPAEQAGDTGNSAPRSRRTGTKGSMGTTRHLLASCGRTVGLTASRGHRISLDSASLSDSLASSQTWAVGNGFPWWKNSSGQGREPWIWTPNLP